MLCIINERGIFFELLVISGSYGLLEKNDGLGTVEMILFALTAS